MQITSAEYKRTQQTMSRKVMWATKPPPVFELKPGIRKCMMCGNDFKSKDTHNKICGNTSTGCKSTAEYKHAS